MNEITFYKDRVCLNVLTSDIENAMELCKVTDGNIVLGLLTKNYLTTEAAIADIRNYQTKLGNKVSIGLGAGDAKQWLMVSEVSERVVPQHVNQVFSSIGYTRAKVGLKPWINCLIKPSKIKNHVIISTGYLSKKQEPAIVPIETAVVMAKEMGANAIKYFPMNGLETKEQFKQVCEQCSNHDMAIEPTGGIDLQNFAEILDIALKSGVAKIIPHVYSSIIDEQSGKTKVEDVKQLYDTIKGIV